MKRRGKWVTVTDPPHICRRPRRMKPSGSVWRCATCGLYWRVDFNRFDDRIWTALGYRR